MLPSEEFGGMKEDVTDLCIDHESQKCTSSIDVHAHHICPHSHTHKGKIPHLHTQTSHPLHEMEEGN